MKIRRGVVRVDGEFIVGLARSDPGSRGVAIPPHLVPLVKNRLKKFTAPGRDALLFPASADENLHMAPSTRPLHPGAAMRYQHAAADRDAEIARRLSALVEVSDLAGNVEP